MTQSRIGRSPLKQRRKLGHALRTRGYRITIQVVTDVNTKGSVSESVSTFASLLALTVYLHGDENVVQENLRQSEAEVRFELLPLPGVKPKMRVLSGIKLFDILWVEQEEWYTHIYAREIQS